MRTIRNIVLMNIILLLIPCMWSCEDEDDDRYSSSYDRHIRVQFINEADENVYLAHHAHSSKDLVMSDPLNWGLRNMIHPGDSVTIYDNEYNLNYYHIIVWKQSTMDRYTREEIREKAIYDMRYVLPFLEIKNDDKHVLKQIIYTGE